jgi:hypothetical protein
VPRRPGRPTVLPHDFVAQDGVPADPWSGLAPCRECHKVGKAGDAQHPDKAPVRAATVREAAAREVEARILGEREW